MIEKIIQIIERNERERLSVFSLTFRSSLLFALLWYSYSFFVMSMAELGEYPYFLHLPNLVIHEAGHVIFGLFNNEFLMFLGGSLLQVVLPAFLMVAFLWKNRDATAAAVFLWWTGQNLVDVAPYINDARALQLQLLGGGTGMEVEGHDWEFILSHLGLIHRDVYIARAVLLAGRIVMAVALCWCFVALLGDWRILRANLEEK